MKYRIGITTEIEADSLGAARMVAEAWENRLRRDFQSRSAKKDSTFLVGEPEGIMGLKIEATALTVKVQTAEAEPEEVVHPDVECRHCGAANPDGEIECYHCGEFFEAS
jgi:hypothetical protein